VCAAIASGATECLELLLRDTRPHHVVLGPRHLRFAVEFGTDADVTTMLAHGAGIDAVTFRIGVARPAVFGALLDAAARAGVDGRPALRQAFTAGWWDDDLSPRLFDLADAGIEAGAAAAHESGTARVVAQYSLLLAAARGVVPEGLRLYETALARWPGAINQVIVYESEWALASIMPYIRDQPDLLEVAMEDVLADEDDPEPARVVAPVIGDDQLGRLAAMLRRGSPAHAVVRAEIARRGGAPVTIPVR
jgi:hypothetical protein